MLVVAPGKTVGAASGEAVHTSTTIFKRLSWPAVALDFGRFSEAIIAGHPQRRVFNRVAKSR